MIDEKQSTCYRALSVHSISVSANVCRIRFTATTGWEVAGGYWRLIKQLLDIGVLVGTAEEKPKSCLRERMFLRGLLL